MKPSFLLLSVLFALLLGTLGNSNDKVHSAKFVSCGVQKGHYGPQVTVQFIPGRTPELFTYRQDGTEIQQMFVDKLDFNDLHTLITSLNIGFKREEGH
ncbi:Seleno protein M2 [Dunaliella salina]|uniref:Seleno protein M2 n=1 Tax=Dunaliella salina TaxID=3046 RepID=A0ABQ7GTL2_DUNSA|nr:Seleno protein M2 [Dunaliella salina]|eukprot:KAF5837938.1 Seleno protein M2 [Dunaliella salina]